MIAKSLLTALAALGFVASAHAASPGAAEDTVTVKVQASDLNLHSEKGASVALKRIQVAAERICGGEPDSRALAEGIAYRACYRSTVDRTVASLDNPIIASLNGPSRSATVLAVGPR